MNKPDNAVAEAEKLMQGIKRDDKVLPIYPIYNVYPKDDGYYLYATLIKSKDNDFHVLTQMKFHEIADHKPVLFIFERNAIMDSLYHDDPDSKNFIDPLSGKKEKPVFTPEQMAGLTLEELKPYLI
jgi:hypothetical protein